MQNVCEIPLVCKFRDKNLAKYVTFCIKKYCFMAAVQNLNRKFLNPGYYYI